MYVEFRVVYTDRALNHMSQRFQSLMRDISRILATVYGARSAIVVPASGSYGMEAAARKNAPVIRNGWISYRWTHIFEMGRIPAEEIVLQACITHAARQSLGVPVPVSEAVAAIRAQEPHAVFAPHVEFPDGMILANDSLPAVANAVREVGGLSRWRATVQAWSANGRARSVYWYECDERSVTE